MKVKQFVKLMKKDEGSGLILALMTLMVLSILGAALGAITIGSYKLGDVNRDDNSAYYIAEAGANLAFEELQIKVNDTYSKPHTKDVFFEINDTFIKDTFIPKVYNETNAQFTAQFGEDPEASVTIGITENELSRDYNIISVGKIGQRTRTVEKNVKVTWISKTNTGPGYSALPNSTTIAKDSLNISSGVVVDGSVYLDSADPNSLIIDSQFDKHDLINLTVYVKPGSVDDFNQKHVESNVTINERVNEFDWTVYTDLLKKFPTFPENPDYTYLPSTIDTKDKNISIVLDDLTLIQNQKINIVGNGRVDVYVRNSLDINGNVSINDGGDIEQLQIFYEGTEHIESGTSFIFNGTLFVKEANIDFKNGVKLEGLVISGGPIVNLGKGEYNSLVIAPNATITLDTSSNNNYIMGITVGKHVELAQNMSIDFSDYYLENFPLTVPDPESDGSGDGSGSSGGGELIITEPGIEN